VFTPPEEDIELKPTPGLRVELTADEHPDGDWPVLTVASWSPGSSQAQAVIDAAYINQCIEEHEQRAKTLVRPEESGDLLVDLGDLRNAKLGTLVQDEMFELMVMDYLDTFNNAVIQGVPPFRSARAMAQAFSLLLGNCVRAGLHPGLAAAVLEGVIQATKAAGERVKVITKSQH
jgi:hypothetical protein